MMIDGDKYDFVDNIDDQDLVLDIIDNKLREIGNL